MRGKARATIFKRDQSCSLLLLGISKNAAKAMVDLTLRYLQSADDGQRKISQFLAFVLWNLLLLFCCVLPTLRSCARRRWTNRDVRLPTHQQQTESSMNSGAGDMHANAGHQKQKIEAVIMRTTMVRAVNYAKYGG